jgi:DnaJ-class molecular chaperone
MGKGKRTDKNKIFNPEKYGVAFCPDCKGKGKLFKNRYGPDVYSRCGGSGLIINEKKVPEEDRK